MRTEKFICYSCGRSWQDTYSFWRGYHSPCPGRGRACQAFCDTEVFVDQEEMAGLVIDGPPLDPDIEDERTEADLEVERGQIHDEIAEALGAVGSAPATDDDSDTEGDADADGGDSGDGF